MSKFNELKNKHDIPVVVANQSGEITYVNKQFEDLFGWNTDEITGEPLTTIIPKHLHDAHHLGFSRFITTEKPTLLEQPLELVAVKKDGEQFKAEHIIHAEKINGEWHFLATLRPIENLE